MRTLKKTLCLVLCLAMMVGLCAFGATAAFEDQDEIKNTEAVALMAGIGVIEGYPDGTFDPAKIFNRAEAAKIIAYLLLGKEAAEALPKANTQFTDVPASHWASGFIGYCADQGIVNGVGHDKFNPTGELTAAAWGKMLLCALGYNAEIESMTGDGWDFNVTRLVSSTKLADGMAFSAKTPMSRDNAALLAFNALTIPMVYYKGGVNVSTKEGTTVSVNSELDTTGDYLAEKFNLKVNDNNNKKFGKDAIDNVRTGVITTNSANDDVKTTTLTAAVAADDTAGTYKIDTGAELLGHYVAIYTSADGKQAFSVVDLSNVVTVAKATTTAAAFQKAFGKAPITNANTVVAIGAALANDLAANAAAGTYILTPANKLAATVNPAYAVVSLDKVTKVDAEAKTISFTGAGANLANGKDDSDVVREYDGIAKDDYVIITKMGAIYNVAKCETVEGTISKIGTDAALTITLDGTGYAKSGATDAIAKGIVAVGADDMKTNTYRLYLDNDGKYIACELVAGESKSTDALYVVATFKEESTDAYGTKSTNYYAQVVDAAGKEDKILIGVNGNLATGVSAGDPATIDAGNGQFYTFAPSAIAASKKLGVQDPTLVAADAVATPAAPGQDTIAAGSFKTTDKTKNLVTLGQKVYLNSETVYLFIKGSKASMKVEVKTGGINMDLTAAAKVLFAFDADANRFAKVVVYDNAYADSGVAAGSLLYFTDDFSDSKTGTTAAGLTYSAYDCATGKEVEITVKSPGVADDGKSGFYKYNKVGELAEVKDYMNAADTSTGLGQILYNETYTGKIGSSIHLSVGDYAITDDTIIVDVRAASAIGTEGALTTLASIDAAKKASKTVTFDVMHDKTNATIIFVKAVA